MAKQKQRTVGEYLQSRAAIRSMRLGSTLGQCAANLAAALREVERLRDRLGAQTKITDPYKPH